MAHHAAALEHIAVVRDRERHLGVLFHEQHVYAVVADLADDLRDLVNHHRRKTNRRLVEQQDARGTHQRARNGHHLLLSAAKRSGWRSKPRLQSREQRHATFHVPRYVMHFVTRIGAQLEVLAHRHLAEQAPALRHHGQAPHDDMVWLHSGDVVTEQVHPALVRMEQSAHAFHERRLAGPVCANQGHDLPPQDAQADVAQRRHHAVGGLQLTDLEARAFSRHELSPDRPSARRGPHGSGRACRLRAAGHDEGRAGGRKSASRPSYCVRPVG